MAVTSQHVTETHSKHIKQKGMYLFMYIHVEMEMEMEMAHNNNHNIIIIQAFSTTRHYTVLNVSALIRCANSLDTPSRISFSDLRTRTACILRRIG
jgi:hypothetical protein